jgi:hypothetical protein
MTYLHVSGLWDNWVRGNGIYKKYLTPLFTRIFENGKIESLAIR